MTISKLLITLDSHTEGEPTRILLAGILNLPGKTMIDKINYIKKHYDYIRKALIKEPRGHQHMFSCALTQPISDDTHAGVIWMDDAGFLNMCGHGTIGVITSLVQYGFVDAVEPKTMVNLDTPAGKVYGYAEVINNNVVRAGFKNVDGFVDHSDLTLDIPAIGCIKVDITYGGNYFAAVCADDIGLELTLSNQVQIKELGVLIRDAVREQFSVQHPTVKHIKQVDITTFYTTPQQEDGIVKYIDTHVFGSGQIDRSPGGTGTTAMLSLLYQKQIIQKNQKAIVKGIAGGQFHGKVIDSKEVSGKTMCVTVISGTAHIMGINQFYLNSSDPFRHGL